VNTEIFSVISVWLIVTVCVIGSNRTRGSSLVFPGFPPACIVTQFHHIQIFVGYPKIKSNLTVSVMRGAFTINKACSPRA